MDDQIITRVDSNKRVCAVFIDLFLVSVLNTLLILMFRVPVIAIATSILAFILLTLRDSASGRSPGKRFVGLQVVDLSGKPISAAASFKRNIILFWSYLVVFMFPAPVSPGQDQALTAGNIFAFLVSLITLVIYATEYITATRRKDGRRLGDMIAETKVIDLKPATPAWPYAILAFVLIVLIIRIGLLGR